VVDQVILFLKGRSDKLQKLIDEKMCTASKHERFEEAARLRDQSNAIKTLSERQIVSQTRLTEEDIVVAHEKAGMAIVNIFQVRKGKMIGERSYFFDRLGKLDMPEALSAFIRQFYTGSMTIPKTVVVSQEPDQVAALIELLSAKRGSKVEIVTPQQGARKKLLDMASSNAKLKLSTRVHSVDGSRLAAEEIAKLLNLDESPTTIEGYDISNTGGVAATGSVVTFKDGVPHKASYRKYKIKTVGGQDDYASMAEVISRRFARLDAKGAEFADLLVIDGGKGQVKAVVESFDKIGVAPPPVVGIAKGKQRENIATDEFYLPGENKPVEFPPSSPGRFLLQRIRDEAHRFAITYHKKLRDGGVGRSVLDDIPGVGPKRKKALLKTFGSVARIRSASVTDVARTLKVSEKVAKEICERL
jgi:excinuclease ABC subunit C